jgi:hypothetical protein
MVLGWAAAINTAKADETLAKNIIKKAEGFTKVCKEDGHQFSVGFGSRHLCKKFIYGVLKKRVTLAVANADLNEHFPEYRQQVVAKLKQINNHYYSKYKTKVKYTDREINILTIVAYQKGAEGMHQQQAFFDWLFAYKINAITKEQMTYKFASLGCSTDKNGKRYLNNGVLARHYATSALFFGDIKDVAGFVSLKDNKQKIDLLKPIIKC